VCRIFFFFSVLVSFPSPFYFTDWSVLSSFEEKNDIFFPRRGQLARAAAFFFFLPGADPDDFIRV